MRQNGEPDIEWTMTDEGDLLDVDVCQATSAATLSDVCRHQSTTMTPDSTTTVFSRPDRCVSRYVTISYRLILLKLDANPCYLARNLARAVPNGFAQL